MMSRKHEWIFIHVPKTGGDWVEASLSRGSEDRIILDWGGLGHGFEATEILQPGQSPGDPGYEKHNTWFRYRELLGAQMLARFTCFYVVRNVWDRAQSHFLYRQRVSGPLLGGFLGFLQAGEMKPLDHYVPYAAAGDSLIGLPFEDLTAQLRSLALHKGWPHVLAEKRNGGPPKDPGFWTPENLNAVAERFHAEIEFFKMKETT